jgi:hypothetical protein
MVAHAFTTVGMLEAGAARNVRLLRWVELDRLLPIVKPPQVAKRGVTRVGRSVAANKKEITLLVASLGQLLDDKIAALREDRRNDPESIAAHAKTLSDYEELRERISQLEVAVAAFKATPRKSEEMAKKASAFRLGFDKWIKGGKNPAFSTAYGVGLLLLGTGLCSLMGVPSAEAAAINGVIVGGAPVAKALKGLVKVKAV